jgi:hypothetical protein
VKVEWLPALYPRFNDVFVNESVEPSHLFIGSMPNGITEVHFNSFGFCDKLASMINRKVGGRVFVVIYQSTAEAGYLSFYEKGEKRRSIEFGDGEITDQEGTLLDFESEPLGHDIGEPGEPFFVFDSDDLERYLDRLDTDIPLYGPEPPEWQLVFTENKPSSLLSLPKEKMKPWWKFW